MQEGYQVTRFTSASECDQDVAIQFEMPYLDWLKLEKSKAWIEVVHILEDSQSKYNQRRHLKNQYQAN